MTQTEIAKEFIKNNINHLRNKFTKKMIINIFKFKLTSLILYYYSPIYRLVIHLLFGLLLNTTYWFILGVLSTIGFGFGFHTGVLFLIPRLVDTYEGNIPGLFITNWIPLIFWSLGSSIGELPPYYIVYNNRERINTFIGESNKYLLKFNKSLLKVNNSCFRRIIITFFAAWPNMTFDMCGILCGYMQLPLKEFIIPTIIGKTCIKMPLQVITVVKLLEKGYEYNYIPGNTLRYVIFFVILLATIIKYYKSHSNH